MRGYQHLNDFELGVIVKVRQKEYSISKVAMKSGFLGTRISQVYREYPVPVKHQISDIRAAGKRP